MSMSRKSKKQLVIEAIYELCMERGSFIFSNNDVKEISKEKAFGNPFDATKIDTSTKLPEVLLKKDLFIIHLGEGKHKFVKGINVGFHIFEEFEPSEEELWKYRPSILNEFDTSESNILSIVFNQRVVHDFLYEDIVANPKMYGSRRTKASFSFKVGSETISVKNLQMEIDLTTEYHGEVTIFEAKNGNPKDFAVYQLYFPFRYYYELKQREKLPIKNINCCYILRTKQKQGSEVKMFLYTFNNPYDMGSIELIKKRKYKLIWRK